jgi:hypothetical protein
VITSCADRDLTDSQRTWLEPLLSQGIKPNCPQVMEAAAVDRRHTVGTRTGAPWRDVPERCGPWDRVYGSWPAGCANDRTGCGPTRRTTPAATVPTCADVGSRPRFPSRRTGSATGRSAAQAAPGRRHPRQRTLNDVVDLLRALGATGDVHGRKTRIEAVQPEGLDRFVRVTGQYVGTDRVAEASRPRRGSARGRRRARGDRGESTPTRARSAPCSAQQLPEVL